MSILKDPPTKDFHASPPINEKGPLFVKFGKFLRTKGDDGITLYETVAKFSDGTAFAFPKDQLTVYDRAFGPDGKLDPLTNPLRIEKNGQWFNIRALPVGQHSSLFNMDVVEEIADIKKAPKPEKKEWSGGGKRGQQWTPKQLEACYDYWLMFMQQRYGNIDAGDPAVIGHLLQAVAYAVDGMVEISSMACKPEDFTGEKSEGSPEPPPVDDDDIPF